jgi:hypothetical protein
MRAGRDALSPPGRNFGQLSRSRAKLPRRQLDRRIPQAWPCDTCAVGLIKRHRRRASTPVTRGTAHTTAAAGRHRIAPCICRDLPHRRNRGRSNRCCCRHRGHCTLARMHSLHTRKRPARVVFGERGRGAVAAGHKTGTTTPVARAAVRRRALRTNAGHRDLCIASGLSVSATKIRERCATQ